MKRLKLNKRSLIKWKVYIDRSRMYIGYIQFFLIGIVFLKEYKDTSWGEKIFEYTWISVPISLILFIFLYLRLESFITTLFVIPFSFRAGASPAPTICDLTWYVGAGLAPALRIDKFSLRTVAPLILNFHS
jgi:hypothetical protein